jgi:hypothetical protein
VRAAQDAARGEEQEAFECRVVDGVKQCGGKRDAMRARFAIVKVCVACPDSFGTTIAAAELRQPSGWPLPLPYSTASFTFQRIASPTFFGRKVASVAASATSSSVNGTSAISLLSRNAVADFSFVGTAVEASACQ